MSEGGPILTAAQSGDEVAALEAMRDRLAAAMDAAPVTVVAIISARLQAVLERLSGLRSGEGVTLDDVLATRRAEREREAHAAGRTRRRNSKSAS